MVSKINISFLIFSFHLLISSSIAQTSFRPRALVLPVTKDLSNGFSTQYVVQISQRTPLVPVKLTILLDGQFLWVDCLDGYVSSSYKPAYCNSAPCYLARTKLCSNRHCGCSDCCGLEPGQHNNTCELFASNPYNGIERYSEVAQDVVALQSTDGSNLGPVVSAPQVIFACASTRLLEGLADGVKGIAGLGRDPIGLPFQLATAFSFAKKFAICLSSSTSSKGVIFFGDGPYNFLPGQDVSKRLAYTPLLKNPVSTADNTGFTGEPSSEYFINVKSIKVNNETVPVNTTLLKIDKKGNGGTKISTYVSYTQLESSIYTAITNAFVNSIGKVSRVSYQTSDSPFTFCYNSSSLGSTRVGPGVPPIELVLPNGVSWTIFGGNSMVPVTNDVLCLGLVDGGPNTRTSIVIGAHQIEDNLLQFDLASTRLGFSSTLLGRQTNCANFNFTSVA